MSRLRVALLYPPPWKIPTEGHTPDPIDGPPRDFSPSDLDSDFFQIPYGLLTLAAEARASGHAVKLFNLSAFPWETVEGVLRNLNADVVGISCWTANRRGVRLVAEAVKRYRPQTHVVIGGPHATPLPRHVLSSYTAIDTVVVGEGEATFIELLERLSHQQDLSSLRGAFFRNGAHISEGPPRPAIESLDRLASPHQCVGTHIVMTSRGCPWACTFCGANASWGRGVRTFGLERVLDDIESALAQVPAKILLIKDDTFTTNRKRVLALCRGIHNRKLQFLWSCDTRVDVLNEELVREMRLAGCERMSLGVESGAASILSAINKNITVQQIINAAELLRRFGIKARFYMMLGNRGETKETFEETLQFLDRAKPHQAIFSCLSIYPGTQDFEEAKTQGWLDENAYFNGNFQELKVPFDATPEVATYLNEWFESHRGIQEWYVPTVEDLRLVSDHLGNIHAPALVELAEALIEQGELDEAESLLNQALSLNYPLPGIIYNARACLSYLRQDYAAMKEAFVTAARLDPQHYVLLRNATLARNWFNQGGPTLGLPLELQVRHDFTLFERTEQPTLPGPLPEGWADWERSNKVTLLPNETVTTFESVDLTDHGTGTTKRTLPTLR